MSDKKTTEEKIGWLAFKIRNAGRRANRCRINPVDYNEMLVRLEAKASPATVDGPAIDGVRVTSPAGIIDFVIDSSKAPGELDVYLEKEETK